jgi:hypothetical protein
LQKNNQEQTLKQQYIYAVGKAIPLTEKMEFSIYSSFNACVSRSDYVALHAK